MARKVVIVGFPEVQALDVVGPHDVFGGASRMTDGGYDVVVASINGQPITTATGLAFVGAPLPNPSDPSNTIDTVVLPGGGGVDAARSNPELVDWIKAVAGNARRLQRRDEAEQNTSEKRDGEFDVVHTPVYQCLDG